MYPIKQVLGTAVLVMLRKRSFLLQGLVGFMRHSSFEGAYRSRQVTISFCRRGYTGTHEHDNSWPRFRVWGFFGGGS